MLFRMNPGLLVMRSSNVLSLVQGVVVSKKQSNFWIHMDIFGWFIQKLAKGEESLPLNSIQNSCLCIILRVVE